MTTEKPVPVIFRVFRKGGDLLALFPTLAGTLDLDTCLCYQHIGQHGSATLGHCMRATRPATVEEAEPLRRELERIGYSLRPVKRSSGAHTVARFAEVHRHAG